MLLLLMEDLWSGSFFKLVLMFLKWFECFPKRLEFSRSWIFTFNSIFMKALDSKWTNAKSFATMNSYWGRARLPATPWFLVPALCYWSSYWIESFWNLANIGNYRLFKLKFMNHGKRDKTGLCATNSEHDLTNMRNMFTD